ncbi:prefoldin subunit alpha [Candidatus Pacearchaeota archaeon]|nr:prefoldin subunit alpha [Candidatus Pacearchaeota archaeon]
MEEPSQEMMFKLQMFDQQIKQLQQQLEAVAQGIAEMTGLSAGLDELVGKTGKEIFAPIGRGIFAKAKLESEELNVDVGGGNFVQKSIPDTKKIIEVQIKKLEDVKRELEDGLQKIGEEFNKTIMEVQAGEEKGEEGKEKGKEGEGKGKKIDELV